MRLPPCSHLLPPLSSQADERDIFKFFSQVGTVNDIQLITDKNTKRSKGMAYIEFKAQEEVFKAIATLNGQLFMNMPLMVRVRGRRGRERILLFSTRTSLRSPLTSASLPLQIKGSEVEKNLAWEAQQAVKQQQSNADAANSMLSTLGAGVPAGLGSCRLQVGDGVRHWDDG